MGLAIPMSAKSCCRLSWERWLHPLHLLGPVLLWCCRLQLTSLYLMIVLQPPLPCEGRDGPLCLYGDSSVLMDLRWPCDVQLRAVFWPLVQYLSFFCEAFSLAILDSSSFLLFHSGQAFHQLVCPLTVVLPQIFFNLTTLFSIQFSLAFFSCTSWCCCSLPCISQILQNQIFSFSVLSFCRTDKEFL